ncbi:hypothetical protein BTVI_100059 [Pitangus sulphuratus]|nr:hypothetical protein BTVI_100059 [Pitangus sulphuratus]
MMEHFILEAFSNHMDDKKVIRSSMDSLKQKDDRKYQEIRTLNLSRTPKEHKMTSGHLSYHFMSSLCEP